MLTKKQYRNVWIVGIIFVAILGIIDILGIPLWFTDQVKLYAEIYWVFVAIVAATAGIIYWIVKKDKSEAVAISAIFYILSTTGLEDFFFYIFKDQALPTSMPHLMNHAFIGTIAKIMGLETVTPIVLIVSIILGGIITYYVSKYLIKKF